MNLKVYRAKFMNTKLITIC